jgi:hypothetical protein
VRYVKAVSIVVGSYYAGVLGGAILILFWGWGFHGYSNHVGVAAALLQGVAGVSIFEAVLDYFPTDKTLRLRTAAVITWGSSAALLGVTILHAWLLGTSDAWEFASAVAGAFPWCIWTVRKLRVQPRAASSILEASST